MKRVRIEYLDHNDAFARLLPVSGTVIQALTNHEGPAIWWVVRLDQQMEYQLGADGTGHRLLSVSEIVVTSRWEGYEVGGDEPTSVHILLPLEQSATMGPSYQPEAFYAVAWGMCYTSAAA